LSYAAQRGGRMNPGADVEMIKIAAAFSHCMQWS
jgi:hypothetical protein